MNIQAFIAEHLKNRLAHFHRLVVYDPDRRYCSIVSGLGSDRCRVIAPVESTIEGREAAMEAWVAMGRTGHAEDRLHVEGKARDERGTDA